MIILDGSRQKSLIVDGVLNGGAAGNVRCRSRTTIRMGLAPLRSGGEGDTNGGAAAGIPNDSADCGQSVRTLPAARARQCRCVAKTNKQRKGICPRVFFPKSLLTSGRCRGIYVKKGKRRWMVILRTGGFVFTIAQQP